MDNNWRIEEIWNESIKGQQKTLTPRQHIWAGEIGKNYYERYLKMLAVPPTNPPDDRVLRKFSAGIWFEEQIGYILERIGILKAKQEWIEIPETADHLRITGKIDYIAGGLTNWADARSRVLASEFPDFIKAVSLKLINDFEAKYPEGLKDILYEIKSVNSQVFWAKKDYLDEAYPHHIMQLYTYLKAKGASEGRVFYISKDDLTVKEIPIFCPSAALEERWMKDVTEMSRFIRQGIEPPVPESVVFDPRKKLRFQRNKMKCVIQGSFDTNWEVAWSSYFSKITGCKTVEEWEYAMKKTIAGKNDELKKNYDEKAAATAEADSSMDEEGGEES